MLARGILSVTAGRRAATSITVVARGLTTPGGFTWNANDTLFVALAGSGGSEPVLPEAPAPARTADLRTHRCGGGHRRRLPDANWRPASSPPAPPQGRIYGAEAIAELDGQLYLLISNAGDRYGASRADRRGLPASAETARSSLIADHAAFLQENPPAVAPPEGFPNPGNPVAMVAGDGALWIADELNGLITKVTPGGDETLVADLSEPGIRAHRSGAGRGRLALRQLLGEPVRNRQAPAW